MNIDNAKLRSSYQNDWKIRDVSEEFGTINCQSIIGYSEMLEEETEIAQVWPSDLDIDEQMDNLSLMANAPKMWRLLIENKEFLETIGETLKAKNIENLLLDVLNQTVINERENK